MPYSVSHTSIEHICSEIKKVEDNPQHQESEGPAINNLPIERGSRSSHFDGHEGRKGSANRSQH